MRLVSSPTFWPHSIDRKDSFSISHSITVSYFIITLLWCYQPARAARTRRSMGTVHSTEIDASVVHKGMSDYGLIKNNKDS